MVEQKPKKNKVAFGCLFWIAFILLVLVVFFINKDTIQGVLKETQFLELVLQSNPADKENIQPLDSDSKEVIDIKRKEPVSAEPLLSAPITAVPSIPAEKPSEVKPEAESAADKTKTQDQVQIPPEVKKAVPDVPKPSAKTVASKLYFINIDPDGKVVRKEVTRSIAQTDSPLTDTLQALFKGPNFSEIDKGFITLIPQGTKLLSVTVQNGVASINVSDEFQYNQYGIEGYAGQLMQIVFTATAYSTVNSVQIIIDGQRKEYLGAEGVWIGTPLNRNSF